jgi:hypothetical protein
VIKIKKKQKIITVHEKLFSDELPTKGMSLKDIDNANAFNLRVMNSNAEFIRSILVSRSTTFHVII